MGKIERTKVSVGSLRSHGEKQQGQIRQKNLTWEGTREERIIITPRDRKRVERIRAGNLYQSWRTDGTQGGEKERQLSATCQKKTYSNQFQLLLSALIFVSFFSKGRSIAPALAARLWLRATTEPVLFFLSFFFFWSILLLVSNCLGSHFALVFSVVGSCPLGSSILSPLWLVSLSFCSYDAATISMENQNVL